MNNTTLPVPPVPPVPKPGPDIPWPGNPAERPQPREWSLYQQGNADGVIYLGEIADTHFAEGTIYKTVHVEGLLRKAMPFLRPVDLPWKKRHPGMIGHAFPAYWRTIGLTQPEQLSQIDRLSRTSKQPVQCLLLADRQAAIECNQPEYRNNWAIVPTPVEGVWAVFYLESSA